MGSFEVFDESFRAKHLVNSGRAASKVARLCSNTSPANVLFRTWIETWFRDFARNEKQSKREQILARLRDDQDHLHLSAVYELFLYQFFKSRSWGVAYEAELKNKTPDFTVTIGQSRLYFEALTRYDTAENSSRRKLADDVILEIQALRFPWITDMALDVAGDTKPDKAALLEDIANRIKTKAEGTLEINQHGFRGIMSWKPDSVSCHSSRGAVTSSNMSLLLQDRLLKKNRELSRHRKELPVHSRDLL